MRSPPSLPLQPADAARAPNDPAPTATRSSGTSPPRRVTRLMAPPTASAPNSIGGTPRHTSTRSRPATGSVDRSMRPLAARDSGMPSTSTATSFASEPRIDTDVNEPSPPCDLTNTPVVPSRRSATDTMRADGRVASMIVTTVCGAGARTVER